MRQFCLKAGHHRAGNDAFLCVHGFLRFFLRLNARGLFAGY